MIIKLKRMQHLCSLIMLIFTSCSFFDKPYIQIDTNHLSEKSFYFADLDDDYKRSSDFNRIWSKLHSKRYRPYHRFLEKKYTIIGTYKTFKKEYLVIKDQKGRKYKMVFDLQNFQNNKIPSYILFEDILFEAKKMIGKTIWLNNTFDRKGFFTFSDYNFKRFEPVKVLDVFSFQNINYDYPVWLKIKTNIGDEAFVRYNGDEGRVGIQDHYYTSEPLPNSWGKETIRKILDEKIELGMTDRQVRISIGNPDEVNSTSSRHGVGEQWIYRDVDGEGIFYQFEYGILTYVNN